MPWFMGNSRPFFHEWGSGFQWGGGFAWILPFVVWSIASTGSALWNAAKRDDKGWFVFFLFVHTAGIIEFIYLIFVAHIFNQPAKTTPRLKKKR